eukprot:Skav234988  [mRNA]  locus=scaffold122:236941:237697:+ [translate_table: standard]
MGERVPSTSAVHIDVQSRGTTQDCSRCSCAGQVWKLNDFAASDKPVVDRLKTFEGIPHPYDRKKSFLDEMGLR